MAEIKSLTGLVGQSQLSGIVSDLVAFIKGQDTNVTNAYKALIGELGKTEGENPVDHTVKSFVEAAIAKVNGAAEGLEGRVGGLETAVDLLNDGQEVEGSVAYQIAQAFNDFATKVSDDKVVNTFKEMIDYVAAHGTEYSNLAALVGTLPEGSGVSTVVAYAKKLADAAQAEADGRLDTIEADYLKAADKTELSNAISGLENGQVKTNKEAIEAINNTSTGILKKAQDYADGLADNYDASGAAAAVQGETTETVASCVSAINGFSLATDAQINAIKALIA